MPKISFRGIGIPTPGGSSVDEVWVEYKGNIETEVPEGEKFKIFARGTANIPDQFTGCEILITAISSDGLIARYDRTNPTLWQTGPIYDSGDMHLEDEPGGGTSDPTMPDHDITLEFTIWGNDNLFETVPPVSEW